jgi:hypothetical protein
MTNLRERPGPLSSQSVSRKGELPPPMLARRPPTPTLPHQGGGSLPVPSPLVVFQSPPSWWGRAGVGGSLPVPSPLVGEGRGGRRSGPAVAFSTRSQGKTGPFVLGHGPWARPDSGGRGGTDRDTGERDLPLDRPLPGVERAPDERNTDLALVPMAGRPQLADRLGDVEGAGDAAGREVRRRGGSGSFMGSPSRSSMPT